MSVSATFHYIEAIWLLVVVETCCKVFWRVEKCSILKKKRASERESEVYYKNIGDGSRSEMLHPNYVLMNIFEWPSQWLRCFNFTHESVLSVNFIHFLKVFQKTIRNEARTFRFDGNEIIDEYQVTIFGYVNELFINKTLKHVEIFNSKMCILTKEQSSSFSTMFE